MPYYLVPMIDVRPSLRRPGRMVTQALGLEQVGASCVRLGSTERALIWTPSPIIDPRAMLIGARKEDALNAKARDDIAAFVQDRVVSPGDAVDKVTVGMLR